MPGWKEGRSRSGVSEGELQGLERDEEERGGGNEMAKERVSEEVGDARRSHHFDAQHKR